MVMCKESHVHKKDCLTPTYVQCCMWMKIQNHENIGRNSQVMQCAGTCVPAHP